MQLLLVNHIQKLASVHYLYLKNVNGYLATDYILHQYNTNT